MLKAVDDVRAGPSGRGETLGCGRRIWLRQDPRVGRVAAGHLYQPHLRRSLEYEGQEGDTCAIGRIPLQYSKKAQMVFQDPICFPEPPHDGGRHRCRAHRRAMACARNAAAHPSACTSCCETVGIYWRAGQPLRARVFRRPAPAHRHCPRACHSSRSSSYATSPSSALDVSIQSQVINLLKEACRISWA